MKNKFMVVASIFILALTSCQNNDNRYLSSKDSTDILTTVLGNQDFKKALETKKDTVFILKTKKYNKSWPSSAANFKVVYIDDSKDNRIINKGPDSPYDGRLRLTVPFFDKKADTVFLTMVNIGFETSYDFKLVLREKNWRVIDQKYLIN